MSSLPELKTPPDKISPRLNPPKMAKIVNLRLFSKQKQREARALAAAENAAKFGQTKAERARIKAESDLQKSRLDAVKREDP
jgi:hypothetical protein